LVISKIICMLDIQNHNINAFKLFVSFALFDLMIFTAQSIKQPELLEKYLNKKTSVKMLLFSRRMLKKKSKEEKRFIGPYLCY